MNSYFYRHIYTYVDESVCGLSMVPIHYLQRSTVHIHFSPIIIIYA